MPPIETILASVFAVLLLGAAPVVLLLVRGSTKRAQADLARRLGLAHVAEPPYGYLIGRVGGYDLRVEGASRWQMSVGTPLRSDFVVYRPFRLKHEYLRGTKVETGDAAFDAVYLLRSKQPEAARALFADADIRALTRELHPLGVVTLAVGNARLWAHLHRTEPAERVAAAVPAVLALARALDASAARG